MVALAVDIVAFCIVAAAVLAAAAALGAICSAFGRWLDAARGRRHRFRWSFWSAVALAFGALWWSTSRTTFLAATVWAALIGIAVRILRLKDRWPAVGVALVWLTWSGLLLGLIAAVLRAKGWLP